MKTSKQSNYRWLLDAGHFGWENDKRHRTNSQACVTLLADMLKKAGIDFSLVWHGDRDTPFKKRTSKVKEFCAMNKRGIYLSFQINNTMETQPHIGMSAIVFSHDRACVDRIGDLLDQCYRPLSKSKTSAIQLQGMKATSMRNLYELMKTKGPDILMTYLLPGGARFAIRKLVLRRIAQTLLRFIRVMEKHKPI